MNDQTEFEALYKTSKEYCLRVLSKWTTNKEDAEELFAEALSIYWIRFKQNKIKSQDNLKAYICKIALNLHRKKAKASQATFNVGNLSDYDHILYNPNDVFHKQEPETHNLFREAFKKLGNDCQHMLTAKYVYDYTYEEIAEDMGRASANSTKVQTFRCVQYLLKIIANLKEQKQNK